MRHDAPSTIARVAEGAAGTVEEEEDMEVTEVAEAMGVVTEAEEAMAEGIEAGEAMDSALDPSRMEAAEAEAAAGVTAAAEGVTVNREDTAAAEEVMVSREDTGEGGGSTPISHRLPGSTVEVAHPLLALAPLAALRTRLPTGEAAAEVTDPEAEVTAATRVNRREVTVTPLLMVAVAGEGTVVKEVTPHPEVTGVVTELGEVPLPNTLRRPKAGAAASSIRWAVAVRGEGRRVLLRGTELEVTHTRPFRGPMEVEAGVELKALIRLPIYDLGIRIDSLHACTRLTAIVIFIKTLKLSHYHIQF